MRVKTAFWVASLTLSLALVGNGICSAQSAPANVRGDEKAKIEQETPAILVARAALPNSPDQADDTAVLAVETAASEPAEPAASAAPAPRENHGGAFSRIGIGVKVSTLGVGIEAATPLAGKLNVRGGFNMMRYSRDLTNNGIHYGAQLQFQSAEAHLDYYPFWGFHVSPGVLFYNGNQLAATAAVPGGQTFTLGSTTYQSESADPVTGTGKLDFVKVSPSIMVGVGNLIPRSGRHFSFLFEVGGAYQGSARVALNLTGTVCSGPGFATCVATTDPTVQANIVAEQSKIQKDINPYRFFPVISLGFGFNF